MTINDIQNIKKRTIKTLQEIAMLKKDLAQQERQQRAEIKSIFLSVIDQIDQIETTKAEALKQAQTDDEITAIKDRYNLSLLPLQKVLLQNRITPLRNTIKTIPQFSECVGEIKSSKHANGQVFEVVREGYARGEMLIRPTQVVLVRND